MDVHKKRNKHGSLSRYVKLRVTHAPEIPGTFSPPTQVTDPNMHHGTCVTHVPWCMQGSLISGFLWRWWHGIPGGIPGACAARNFAYLVRGPWHVTFANAVFSKCPRIIAISVDAKTHFLCNNLIAGNKKASQAQFFWLTSTRMSIWKRKWLQLNQNFSDVMNGDTIYLWTIYLSNYAVHIFAIPTITLDEESFRSVCTVSNMLKFHAKTVINPKGDFLSNLLNEICTFPNYFSCDYPLITHNLDTDMPKNIRLAIIGTSNYNICHQISHH